MAGGTNGMTGSVGTGGIEGGGSDAASPGSMGGATAAGSGGTTTGAAGAGGSSASGGQASGGEGAGGTAAGNGGSSGAGVRPNSGLPVPPGGGVPRPDGTPGNLNVLDWAGFAAAVSYSFDDSLASQTQNYSALQATGVRMTFYVVCNNNADNPVWSQALTDGHEVANHTSHHCHDDGSGCAWGTYAGSLTQELADCSAYIIDQIGAGGVYTTAAPFGDGGYASAAMSGFMINRGVNSGQIAPNDATNPFSLPCHLAAENEAASSFNGLIDSARSAGTWQVMLVHSLGGDGGYNPISVSTVTDSVLHAKDAGDVWVDSVVNVGAYWLGQKALAAAAQTTQGDATTTWMWTLPENFPPKKYLRVTMDGGTLTQGGGALAWDDHGYYEIALDEGSLTLGP